MVAEWVMDTREHVADESCWCEPTVETFGHVEVLVVNPGERARIDAILGRRPPPSDPDAGRRGD